MKTHEQEVEPKPRAEGLDQWLNISPSPSSRDLLIRPCTYHEPAMTVEPQQPKYIAQASQGGNHMACKEDVQPSSICLFFTA